MYVIFTPQTIKKLKNKNRAPQAPVLLITQNRLLQGIYLTRDIFNVSLNTDFALIHTHNQGLTLKGFPGRRYLVPILRPAQPFEGEVEYLYIPLEIKENHLARVLSSAKET